jgi:hypothetical protein
VFFEQVPEPGREAAVDFTNCNELGVTVAGRTFPHLLFHFVLSFSGWTWVTLAFSETFEALVRGVQQALWALDGAPAVLRSDNLSAATHELKQTGGRTLTERFKAVLDHYGMTSTRINPGGIDVGVDAEQLVVGQGVEVQFDLVVAVGRHSLVLHEVGEGAVMFRFFLRRAWCRRSAWSFRAPG